MRSAFALSTHERPAASSSARSFGDASGFGDVDVTSFTSAFSHEGGKRGPVRARGFGDGEGFGDAGGIDLATTPPKRRRSDR